MSRYTWKDDEGKIYTSPYISSKTIGFSGIDPTQLIIDGTDTDQIEETPLPQHEDLEQLLGGNDDGHFHLTAEEYEGLSELLEARNSDTDSDADENSTALSTDEYDMLRGLLDEVYDSEGVGPVFPMNWDDDELLELIDARVEAVLRKHGLIA